MEEIRSWCSSHKVKEIDFYSLGLRTVLIRSDHRIAANAVLNTVSSIEGDKGFHHYNGEETLSLKVNLGFSTNTLTHLALNLKMKTGIIFFENLLYCL